MIHGCESNIGSRVMKLLSYTLYTVRTKLLIEKAENKLF